MEKTKDNIYTHVDEITNEVIIISEDQKRAAVFSLKSPLVKLLRGENLTETYKLCYPRWVVEAKNELEVADWISYSTSLVTAQSVH